MSSSAENWAVIVAAGRGERFGSGEPKQFAALAGKPLALWSVEAFNSHPAFAGVTLVLPPASVEAPPAWLERLVSDSLLLTAGGPERSDSVRLGLATVPDEAAAAPNALSWSSLGLISSPVTTGMRSWAILPIR